MAINTDKDSGETVGNNVVYNMKYIDEGSKSSLSPGI